MKNNNKGFSLIELSIVLIIIGLLVAGITGGASLIKSAKLRSVMSEVTNYRVAVNNFYNALERYPGDGQAAEGGTDGAADNVTNGKILGAEVGLAWDDLVTNNILESTDLETDTDLAKSKMSKSAWVIGYYNEETPYYNGIALVGQTTFTPPVYTTTAVDGIVTSTSSSTGYTASVSELDAQVFDTKMDDGNQTEGDVRAIDSKGTSASVDCTYTNSGETIDCVPVFSINL